MPLRAYTEAEMKAEIMKRLRSYSGLAPFRIEDTTTSGLPDIVVVGGGKTTWWEVKLGRPDFQSKGIQERTMLRIEMFGYGRYIIYRMENDGSNQRVSIAHPSDINRPEFWITSVGGFDHDWVVEYILREHRP